VMEEVEGMEDMPVVMAALELQILALELCA
jgi:hypothetical protein